MQSRDDRGALPFGKRRPQDWAGERSFPATTAGIARAPELSRERPAGSLPWALRMSGFVGLLAVLAVIQLARWSQLDETPARVALAARAIPGDPETTGALPAPVARSAQATHLNPCLAPAAGHPRP